jgi:hypothetical protein
LRGGGEWVVFVVEGGLEVKCGVITKAAASKIIKFRLLLFR